jgi:hypothetical protein
MWGARIAPPTQIDRQQPEIEKFEQKASQQQLTQQQITSARASYHKETPAISPRQWNACRLLSVCRSIFPLLKLGKRVVSDHASE